MQKTSGISQQLSTTEKIGSVVLMATVCRTPTCTDEFGVSEFSQEIRNEILGLPQQRNQFTNAAITSTQFSNDAPSQDAKQTSTREGRIDKCAEKILAGKGFRDAQVT